MSVRAYASLEQRRTAAGGRGRGGSSNSEQDSNLLLVIAKNIEEYNVQCIVVGLLVPGSVGMARLRGHAGVPVWLYSS